MRKGDKTPAERRRFPVGVDPRREERQREAIERAEARKTRTVEEQLALIEGRRGESRRERKKLDEA